MILLMLKSNKLGLSLSISLTPLYTATSEPFDLRESSLQNAVRLESGRAGSGLE